DAELGRGREALRLEIDLLRVPPGGPEEGARGGRKDDDPRRDADDSGAWIPLGARLDRQACETACLVLVDAKRRRIEHDRSEGVVGAGKTVDAPLLEPLDLVGG